MSLRKRLLIFLLLLLGASGATALLAPFAVGHGINLWLEWAGRQEGLAVTTERIEAPFLQLVTIVGLKISPAREKPRAVQLQIPRAIVQLDFRGWIFGRRTRLVHSLTIERASGAIRSENEAGDLNWRDLERMLPDEFQIDVADLTVVTTTTSSNFQGVILHGSEIEAGKFFAHKISITSPLVRQVFAELRGATGWEDNRLTIAGISLSPGVDLESLTIDLSSLTKRRIGLDFQLDTFGGNLRASLAAGGTREKFLVDLAGSASNISLAQVSSVMGFVEPLSGSVRASKFTFRGTPKALWDATASVWIEVADFVWRDRRADHVVFGATYYGHRLQVDQLYVQQEKNELTVNGELLGLEPRAAWSTLPFHGQINATLSDADAFAQLFGARPGDFAGALTAHGQIDALAPSAQGSLSLGGTHLTFRGVDFDSLGAKLLLRGSEVTVDNLELRHANDFMRGHGGISLAQPHNYNGRLTGALYDLADYAPLLPQSWRAPGLGGGITFDWSGDGNWATQSGAMQIFAHGLRLPVTPWRGPLDLTLEGTYSPDAIFFRTFRVANERVSLGGFLLLGRNFVEGQALDLAVEGKTVASGTLFLPVSVDHFWRTEDLIGSLDERQKFDVDLTVDRLDLAKLSSALGEFSLTNGILSGKLAAYGPLSALQLTTNWRLENLAPTPAKSSVDIDLRCNNGVLDANLGANFGISSPVSARLSLPILLEKNRLTNWSFIDSKHSFSFTAEFPVLFLETLPSSWQPFGFKSGLVSGRIDFSGMIDKPRISGEAQLLNGQSRASPGWPALTGVNVEVQCEDRAAKITFLNFAANGAVFDWSGSLTTKPPSFTLSLTPSVGISLAAPFPNDAKITNVQMFAADESRDDLPLRKAVISGSLGAANFGLTINPETATTRDYFFDFSAGLSESSLRLKLTRPQQVTWELGAPEKFSDKEIPWP